MGLFNRQRAVNQSTTKPAGDNYLEVLTEREQISHTLISPTFHRCLVLLRQPLLLVSYKLVESKHPLEAVTTIVVLI